MTRQHGHEFLSKVEEIRLLAKTNRQPSNPNKTREDNDYSKLKKILTNLNEESLLSVARAFNQFLNLTNIAEQAESTETAVSSQLEELFSRLQKKGVTQQLIFDAVSNIRCDLVLTAHPTEITRRTLIQKYNRIASALSDVDEEHELDPKRRIDLERLIAEVWFTDEIRT